MSGLLGKAVKDLGTGVAGLGGFFGAAPADVFVEQAFERGQIARGEGGLPAGSNLFGSSG
jgi:hypothetical protein